MQSMPDASRAIIHVDMDAFYASVEQHDDPGHRGRPVIVGGLGRRGVVAAASYEARRSGVRSAMPMARARRLCPDGIYLQPRFDRYRQVSEQVFAVFREFTPVVEGISLDEAWLDVTDSRALFGDIHAIGRRLKAAIRERTGLVASIGMAPNKFLAKLASEHGKPDGFLEITSDNTRNFLFPLSVSRLWGIGPKAAEKLEQAGITTVGELARTDEATLRALLGNAAAHFRQLAHGIDDRPVTPERPEKSVSHEQTYEYDLHDLQAMRGRILALCEDVAARLRRKGLAGATVTVKIRTGGWRTFTRSRTLDEPTHVTREIYTTARELLDRWRSEHSNEGVRLLGVGLGKLQAGTQGGLFQAQGGGVDTTLDSIRERFGSEVIRRGRLVDKN